MCVCNVCEKVSISVQFDFVRTRTICARYNAHNSHALFNIITEATTISSFVCVRLTSAWKPQIFAWKRAQFLRALER